MAVTWKTLAYEDDVVLEADYTAKGVLIAGTGAGTAGALSPGTDTHVLTLDSTETTGMKWSAVGAGDFMADGSVAMTGNLDFDGNQAEQMVLETVADSTAETALTPVVGMAIWRTDLGAPRVCTSAA